MQSVLDYPTDEAAAKRGPTIEMRTYSVSGDSNKQEHVHDFVRQDVSDDGRRIKIEKQSTHRNDAPTQKWHVNTKRVAQKETCVYKLLACLGCSQTAAPWYMHAPHECGDVLFVLSTNHFPRILASHLSTHGVFALTVATTSTIIYFTASLNSKHHRVCEGGASPSCLLKRPSLVTS